MTSSISRATTEYSPAGNPLFSALQATNAPVLQMKTEKGAMALTDAGAEKAHAESGHASGNLLAPLHSALTTLDADTIRGADLTAKIDGVIRCLREIADSSVRAEGIADIFCLMFVVRDAREGKGEKDLAFQMLVRLLSLDKDLVYKVLDSFVREYGCFKDLTKLWVGLKEARFKTGAPSSVDSTLRKGLADKCAEISVSCVASDKAALDADPNADISLAGKWAQRENGSTKNQPTDEATHKARLARQCARNYLALCEGRENMVRHTVDGTIDGDLKPGSKRYARSMWRKVCSCLSKHLDVPEQKMSANEWRNLDPKKIPSVCAHKKKRALQNRDKAGNVRDHDNAEKAADRAKCAANIAAAIKETLANPESAKIKGGRTGIVRLVQDCMNGRADDMTEAMYQNLKAEFMKNISEKGGYFPSFLPLADVSGSMTGTPMEVCIALTCFLTDICSEQWKNQCLTFESMPKWHTITGSTLQERVASLARAPWGSSTNFASALNMILDTAKRARLSQADLPEFMIVFSDMEFDQADSSRSGYRGTHSYRDGAKSRSGLQSPMAAVARAFAENGFECPHMIFWNLRSGSGAKPCETNSQGASLVSGYSEQMLKLFFEGNLLDFKPETPVERLLQSLRSERYNPVRRIVMEHYGFDEPSADADETL